MIRIEKVQIGDLDSIQKLYIQLLDIEELCIKLFCSNKEMSLCHTGYR